jgi:hypothetical protein
VFTFDGDDNCVRVKEFYDRGTALKARHEVRAPTRSLHHRRRLRLRLRR